MSAIVIFGSTTTEVQYRDQIQRVAAVAVAARGGGVIHRAEEVELERVADDGALCIDGCCEGLLEVGEHFGARGLVVAAQIRVGDAGRAGGTGDTCGGEGIRWREGMLFGEGKACLVLPWALWVPLLQLRQRRQICLVDLEVQMDLGCLHRLVSM